MPLMNGYAGYIGSAYGMTLLVLAINIVVTWKEKKRITQVIRQRVSESSTSNE